MTCAFELEVEADVLGVELTFGIKGSCSAGRPQTWEEPADPDDFEVNSIWCDGYPGWKLTSDMCSWIEDNYSMEIESAIVEALEEAAAAYDDGEADYRYQQRKDRIAEGEDDGF